MLGQFRSILHQSTHSDTPYARPKRTVTFTKLLVVSTWLITVSIIPMTAFQGIAHADTNCTPGPTPPPANITLSGSSWLSGNGVNVCNNGSPSTNVWGTNYVGGVKSGDEWQCVELVNRLYLTEGWTTATWVGNGNTLVNNVPSGLTKQNNGSISYVNIGDVITLDDGGFGHAGIINSGSSTVNIINQNAQLNSSAYIDSGSLGSGNAHYHMNAWFGYSVQAFVHHPSTTIDESTMSKPIRADFDGNGKDDVLIAHKSGTDAVNYWVFTSTGSGLNNPVNWSYQPTFSWSNERIVAADIDGDGKKDLVVMHRGGTDGVNLWWFRSTGTGFASPVLLSNPSGFSYNSSKLTAADYSGDGKDDVLITHISGTDAVNHWVFTSTGSGLNGPVLWSYLSTFSWSNEQIVSTDIDGDGKSDIVVMHRAGTDGVNLYWLRSTGTGFASPTGLIDPVSGFSYNSSKITAADFDGNLKGDILIAHISGTDAVNYWVFTSTGSGLNNPVNWSYQPTFSWSNEQIIPADLDGDGKSDIVVMHRAGTDGVNLYWFQSTGTSFPGPTGLIDPVSGFSYNSSKLV